MAKHRPQLHILAYDISQDPKRLMEVHRTVRQWGIPLQYSVFLILATPARLQLMLGELERIIDPRVDDVRVYPLPAKIDIVQIGRGNACGFDPFAGQLHLVGIDPLPTLMI